MNETTGRKRKTTEIMITEIKRTVKRIGAGTGQRSHEARVALWMLLWIAAGLTGA